MDQSSSESYSEYEYESDFSEGEESEDGESQKSEQLDEPQATTPTWLNRVGAEVALENVLINVVKPGWNSFHYFNHYQRQQHKKTQQIRQEWSQLTDEERQPYVEMATQREKIWVLPDWAKPKSGWTHWHYFLAKRRCEMGDQYNLSQIQQEWSLLPEEEWLLYVDLAEANRSKYPRRHGFAEPNADHIFAYRVKSLDLFQAEPVQELVQIEELKTRLIEKFAHQRGIKFFSLTKKKEWEHWWLTLPARDQKAEIRHAHQIITWRPGKPIVQV